KLAAILDAARVAPTGANKQPFNLLVVQSADGLEKVNRSTNIYNAPLAIIVLGDRDKVWVRPFDGKSILDIDTSIVTDHMMLQATELGIGSVWICYFKPDVLKKEFNIPDNLEPVSILALGYADGPAESPHRHELNRKPLSELVSYERLQG
ncbi:MAG TPA: nitroreductase family protein, partial [Chitinispirillaceae bacterium]|nr:nitroreductase family protein [Chitinispirillaceae bacterium]